MTRCFKPEHELRSSVPSGCHRGCLDHEYHRAMWCTGPVSHSSRNEKPVMSFQFHGPVLQIEEQHALKNKEELVFPVVLVPVKLALEHPQADNTVIDVAQGLVPPLLCAFIRELSDIHKLKRAVLHIHVY